MTTKDRIKVTLIRFLRGLGASLIGLGLAKYGNNPIYGPVATSILLSADKYIRTHDVDKPKDKQ